MSVRETTLAYSFLFAEMSVSETQGANKGEVVNWLLRREGGKPGQPWCVAFIAACYELACAYVKQTPRLDVGLSCSRLYRLAKEKGIAYSDLTQIQAGDFILLRGGSTGHKHVGIVTGVDATTIYTVEGNTNAAGGSEGVGVLRKKRPRKEGLYDFVRIEG